MKALTVVLPDSVFAAALEEAEEHGVDVPQLCIGVLCDYFLTVSQPPVSPPMRRNDGGGTAQVAGGKFDVAAAFEGFPRLSVELAQQFTDEAQKFGRTDAFRVRRGIGFDPNFVFVEYLMSRSGMGGIAVSFYGEPDRHLNAPSTLKKGRGSYSRARLYSQSDLDAILPHIKQSYEMRGG